MSKRILSMTQKKRTLTVAVMAVYICGAAGAQAQTKATGQRQGLSLLGAIQSAIAKHPFLHMQEAQVEFARGALNEASGAFDWNLQSSLVQQATNVPVQVTADHFTANGLNGTQAQAGVTRLFRDGVSVGAIYQVGRTEIGQFIPNGENTSNLALVFTIPLLRGRGREAVAAQEDAARMGVEAEVNNLVEVVSQTIQNVASSYWNLVASLRLLNEAKESEKRWNSYAEYTQALIEADQVPRSNMNEAKANVAQRAAARIAAEQNVSAARQQLALDMGLAASDVGLAEVLPTDEFPDPTEIEVPSDKPDAIEYYLQQGLARRGSYLALRRKQAQADLVKRAARNSLLPQVNLTLQTGYSGLNDGLSPGSLLASTFKNVPGPNAVAGITYSFPLGNNMARGTVRQSDALAAQAELSVDQDARTISASIVVALQSVRHSREQLQESHRSVELFRTSLTSEKDRYGAGFGSLIEMLTIEDRLTSAEQDEIQAGLTYALALAQFRFATGTLMNPNSTAQTIPAEIFRTLPFTGRPSTERSN